MTPAFTTEELRMIYRIRHRDRRELLGWLVALLPLAAFAAYGFWHRDAIAAFVAWAGTAVWLLWWLAASGRSTRVLRSVLEKYAAAAPAAPRGESTERGAPA